MYFIQHFKHFGNKTLLNDILQLSIFPFLVIKLVQSLQSILCINLILDTYTASSVSLESCSVLFIIPNTSEMHLLMYIPFMSYLLIMLDLGSCTRLPLKITFLPNWFYVILKF